MSQSSAAPAQVAGREVMLRPAQGRSRAASAFSQSATQEATAECRGPPRAQIRLRRNKIHKGLDLPGQEC